jgi:hypothetical protein
MQVSDGCPGVPPECQASHAAAASEGSMNTMETNLRSTGKQSFCREFIGNLTSSPRDCLQMHHPLCAFRNRLALLLHLPRNFTCPVLGQRFPGFLSHRFRHLFVLDDRR